MPKTASKPLKVLLISTDCASNEYRKVNNAFGGVTYYRLIGPKEALEGSKRVQMDYFGNDQYKDGREDFQKFLGGYDAVISKHIDNPGGAKALAMACEWNKIPLIYDLDDDLFSVREDQPAHELGYNKGGLKRVYAATNMSFASAFFVSTKPLEESYKKFYKEVWGMEIPVYVLPNFTDPGLYDNFVSTLPEKDIVIGYHGSMTHDSDLETVISTIDRLMSKYKNVRCEMIGSVRKDSVKRLFDNVRNRNNFTLMGGTPAFDSFPSALMSQKWSIGIAPLIDDEFNRGKSHIKYMEYSMKKIPTVASDVYPYTHNAKEALLCKTKEDWYTNLEKLIQSPKLRAEIGNKAYESVVKEQQYKDHAYMWEDAMEAVIKSYKKK